MCKYNFGLLSNSKSPYQSMLGLTHSELKNLSKPLFSVPCCDATLGANPLGLFPIASNVDLSFHCLSPDYYL